MSHNVPQNPSLGEEHLPERSRAVRLALPPLSWPSSVPVGRCGAETWPGLLPPSAAHVATTSADGAAFAAMRLRDRHAATCRPLGFRKRKRALRAVTLESERLVVVVVVVRRFAAPSPST